MSDPRLDITIRTMAELQGAERTAKALEQSIGKAKALGKEYAALQQKLDSVKASIEKYNAAAQEEQRAADELGRTYTDYTKRKLPELQQQVGKTISLKRGWREAVRGLSLEFPMLYRAAQLALSPLSLAVGGIVGAFTLWRARMEEARKTLASLELPDLSKLDPARVTQLAEAWNAYSDALKKTIDGYTNINAESDRAIKNIKEQLALELKLAEARGAGPATKVKMQMDADAQITSVQSMRRFGLAIQARNLRQAAGRVQVVDPTVLKDAEAAAQKSQEDIAMHRERISWIGDLRAGSFWDRAKAGLEWTKRYGLTTGYDEAIGMEEAAIARAQSSIDRYNLIRPRAGGGERRAALMGEAGRLQGQADVLGMSAADSALGTARERAPDLARVVGALGWSQPAQEAAMNAILNNLANQRDYWRAILARVAQLERNQANIASRGQSNLNP